MLMFTPSRFTEHIVNAWCIITHEDELSHIVSKLVLVKTR